MVAHIYTSVFAYASAVRYCFSHPSQMFSFYACTLALSFACFSFVKSDIFQGSSRFISLLGWRINNVCWSSKTNSRIWSFIFSVLFYKRVIFIFFGTKYSSRKFVRSECNENFRILPDSHRDASSSYNHRHVLLVHDAWTTRILFLSCRSSSILYFILHC